MPCCMAVLLLASACHNRNNDDDSSNDDTPAYTGTKRTVALHSYGFGLVTKETNTSYGSTETEYRLTEETDTIPARLGTRFGLSYQMTNTTEDELPFTKTWILPHSMKDPNTGDTISEYSYDVTLKPGEMYHATYVLEYPEEVMKGRWELRIKYKKHLMYRHRFFLR